MIPAFLLTNRDSLSSVFRCHAVCSLSKISSVTIPNVRSPYSHPPHKPVTTSQDSVESSEKTGSLVLAVAPPFLGGGPGRPVGNLLARGQEPQSRDGGGPAPRAAAAWLPSAEQQVSARRVPTSGLRREAPGPSRRERRVLKVRSRFSEEG